MLVIVTVIWEDRVLKVDVNTKRKQSHLKQILVKEHGLDRSYRLLFKGKELEERPLIDQGVQDKSEITVMKPQGFVTSGKKENKQELGYMPPVLQDLQTHLLGNPEIMQQMLNSPAMQSLLHDPGFLESIMKMNPATRTSLETNETFEEMLRDPDFRAEAAEAFRNPSTMREILESTDRAVKEIKSLPGGVELITTMHNQLNLPPEIEEALDGPPRQSDSNTQAAGGGGGPGSGHPGAGGPGKKGSGADGEEGGDPNNATGGNQNQDASYEYMREQWLAKNGYSINPDNGELIPPAWHSAMDANAMASMMQDPNLQQLMAQYMETTERENECFASTPFIASLFRPANMVAISSMEMAINAMSTSKNSKGGGPGAPGGGGSKFETLATPASQFSKTFDHFLEAQKENPESKYRVQLTKMRHTGFTNTQKCISALEECGGQVQPAIELLLRQQAHAENA